MNADETRVLIFGRSGQVARELAMLRWPDEWQVVQFGRDQCDLAQPNSAATLIKDLQPRILINAAAYTQVDKAEAEPEAARALNELAPMEMARATAALGATLIHISTDYVFDGRSPRPYLEADECRPLSVYGASKAKGEAAIREYQPRHLILRTSWVFSPFGANFVRTMLRLAETRDELAIVDDQIGGPTAAADIAQTLLKIAVAFSKDAGSEGTYHYAGASETSWFGFARSIFEKAAAKGAKVPKTVRPITSADYPAAAQRPLNSRLDCSAISQRWGIAQPSWRASLDRVLDTLIPGQQSGG